MVHDIITGNPDLTFGIIHITWDSHSPFKDLYGMPDNVAWVKVLYLSMEEHQEDFLRARPRDLRMNRRQRRELSRRILGALLALAQDGQTEPLWDLISEGLSASRRYPVWAILGTREFMEAYHDMMPDLGMSMTDIFWCLRDFFSLAYAVLAEPVPRAQVYHAHTTGYAMLLGVNAAREHGTKVLLTEHNLYVRDTVNTLLERRLDLNVRLTDYRTFDVTGRERMWMAWWLEMGRLCYPYAYASTYLYPRAITEANELGGDSGRAIRIPQRDRHLGVRRLLRRAPGGHRGDQEGGRGQAPVEAGVHRPRRAHQGAAGHDRLGAPHGGPGPEHPPGRVRAHRAHALLLRAVPDPHRRAGPGERHHRARHRQGPRAPARVRPVRPAQLQRGSAGRLPGDHGGRHPHGEYRRRRRAFPSSRT